MDEIIKRDQNFRTVAAAITNDTDQDITMLRADPTTNYLLVDIMNVGATSATTQPTAKRDQNFRPVCLAYDETNNVLQEILTDEDGNLLCDVVFI